MNILIVDSWLREYLNTKATPSQIKEYLSLCGPSVEKVNTVGDDYIYEIEVPSNRVDMASVYGIAREAAAILPRFKIHADLKLLEAQDPQASNTFLPMNISDSGKICNRILGIVMNVEPMKPSPGLIRNRIEKSGIRSLNNLVDITNYVMLEVGHPCHVFDYDRVKTHTFIIRKAKKDEPIITLDNKKYLLSDEDVIIDDGTGRVIDLPGIMGTENSIVTNKTRRIIFFIESNNPVLIRKTSKRYGIRTMAATINEKHPDPELARAALLQGIQLYKKYAGATIVSSLIDIFPNPSKATNIRISADFINNRLGVVLQQKEIIDILTSLFFEVNIDNSFFLITPPSFRQFDITIPEDVVEEIARIYGYHNLPSVLMKGEIPHPSLQTDLPVEEKIKSILKFWGFTECYHYSFISSDLLKNANLNEKDCLKIANPLTTETEYMRTSLIPSMLQTVSKNQYFTSRLEFFELAKVYIPKENNLPNEISMLTLTGNQNFSHIKGIVEGLLMEFGVSDYEGVIRQSHFFHPQQSLTLSKNNKRIATVGKIHPQFIQNFSIKDDIFFAEICIDTLVALANPIKKYSPISNFPEIVEDITLLLPPKAQIGPLISAIYKTSRIIRKVEFIEQYKDASTFRVHYLDEERNLKGEDVQKVRNHMLTFLKSTFHVVLKQ